MINTGEKHLYEWQHGMSGSFYTHLMNAIAKADVDNRRRLYKAYPEEVEAYKKFAGKANYWFKLKQKYESEVMGVS